MFDGMLEHGRQLWPLLGCQADPCMPPRGFYGTHHRGDFSVEHDAINFSLTRLVEFDC